MPEFPDAGSSGMTFGSCAASLGCPPKLPSFPLAEMPPNDPVDPLDVSLDSIANEPPGDGTAAFSSDTAISELRDDELPLSENEMLVGGSVVAFG